MRTKTKKNRRKILLIAIFVLVALIAVFLIIRYQKVNKRLASDLLEVHFIDVGQADCILIESMGEYMLIDSGDDADSETVCKYLDSYDIKEFQYVIATHPHEDHIGAMDTIIYEYGIKEFIMPDITYNSSYYNDMVKALDTKDIDIIYPEFKTKYTLGEAEFTIITDDDYNYVSTNNYSVGIRLVYGNTAYMFCGDIESEAEENMIDSGVKMKADVLKVSHHGSNSSTTKAFLEKVKADYAVISVGKDNEYGHPKQKVLDRLKSFGITIYRTDERGTIISRSDGKNITFSFSKNATMANK